MASKGKSHKRKRRQKNRVSKPSPEERKREKVRKLYLANAMTELAKVAGEDAVASMMGPDLENRQKMIKGFMRSDNPKVRLAIAGVLAGLGLNPDQLTKEAVE